MLPPDPLASVEPPAFAEPELFVDPFAPVVEDLRERCLRLLLVSCELEPTLGPAPRVLESDCTLPVRWSVLESLDWAARMPAPIRVPTVKTSARLLFMTDLRDSWMRGFSTLLRGNTTGRAYGAPCLILTATNVALFPSLELQPEAATRSCRDHMTLMQSCAEAGDLF